MKKLSIITINFNNRDGLRRTIESVVAQTTRDFEYIVIDGGSTDGSVEVIKEYEEYIDYWVSEPDKGIYNAMNKGVQQAHGEYCQFLNSGDWLYDNQVIETFCNISAEEDIIYGKTRFYNIPHRDQFSEVKDTISFMDFYLSGIIHQSCFIKTHLCKSYAYDENYKICSDWKFFIQTLILNNCSFKSIENTIVYYNTTGISATNKELLVYERNHILKSIGIPPRILDNYHNLDRETYEIAELLHPYVGFRKQMYKLIKLLTKFYSKITNR